jgi:hypothetical protein
MHPLYSASKNNLGEEADSIILGDDAIVAALEKANIQTVVFCEFSAGGMTFWAKQASGIAQGSSNCKSA